MSKEIDNLADWLEKTVRVADILNDDHLIASRAGYPCDPRIKNEAFPMNSPKTNMVENQLHALRPNTHSRRESNAQPAHRVYSRAAGLSVCGWFFALGLSGCTALTRPIDGIPARRLPKEFFQEEKNNLVPIDVSLLAREPERNYVLGPGDILGITIDGVLPYSEPDQIPPMPPVNFPDAASTLPPSTGFPTTILEDGTISLPIVNPIEVEGLTTDQARDKIRQTYLDAKILKYDEQRKVSVVVTIIKKREINLIVIRQDQSGGARGGQMGVDYSATGSAIKLDADRADILNALMITGGLPGVSAKNEVKILRNKNTDKLARMQFMQQYAQILATYCDPCSCPPPMPADPTILTIPLRMPPGVVTSITPEDVTLEEGDIVLIETRDTEFFFTGGLLPGAQIPLPRDYDLDALGAMALAGYGVASQSGGGGGGGGGGVGGGGLGGGASQIIPPGRLYILRRTPCNGQLAIEVDLARALNDPQQRPIIQPGDTLVLQHKPCEEIINFGIGTFFTFGVSQFFRN